MIEEMKVMIIAWSMGDIAVAVTLVVLSIFALMVVFFWPSWALKRVPKEDGQASSFNGDRFGH